MINISINLIFILLVPYTVFADCILTDTPYKFEIVCSGYNSIQPSTHVPNKKAENRSHKSRKVYVTEKASETPPIVMTEEELQIMQTKNRQDGWRDRPNLSGKL